jgi:hypothetical protein
MKPLQARDVVDVVDCLKRIKGKNKKEDRDSRPKGS